jgi:uncharacterized Fe-S cluster protein YjdI/CDGSH-type Zn-finger protein
MTKPLQTYERDDITVTFDPNVCIHSGVCLRSLPGVFDVSRRKWIDLNTASAEAIAATVRRCPSGALQVRLRTDGASTAPMVGPGATVTVIELTPNGPLRCEGTLRILREDGSIEERTGTVSFCRCGGSAKKPFCDGSHKRIGFRSSDDAPGS